MAHRFSYWGSMQITSILSSASVYWLTRIKERAIVIEGDISFHLLGAFSNMKSQSQLQQMVQLCLGRRHDFSGCLEIIESVFDETFRQVYADVWGVIHFWSTHLTDIYWWSNHSVQTHFTLEVIWSFAILIHHDHVMTGIFLLVSALASSQLWLFGNEVVLLLILLYFIFFLLLQLAN